MYTFVSPGQHIKLNHQRLWRLVVDVRTEGFIQYVDCVVTTGRPMAFRTRPEHHVYDVRFDCLTVKL